MHFVPRVYLARGFTLCPRVFGSRILLVPSRVLMAPPGSGTADTLAEQFHSNLITIVPRVNAGLHFLGTSYLFTRAVPFFSLVNSAITDSRTIYIA